MRHRFMPAAGPVDVIRFVRSAVVFRRAAVLVWFACFQPVFVYVIAVHMVQMSVVEIIGMAVVPDSHMATIGAMDMGMSFVSVT